MAEGDIKLKQDTIYVSDDYSQFKSLPGNRAIRAGHVEALVKAIEEKDMTKVRPILVNEKLEIVDGQHRFEACKQLGLKIYYQIQKGATSFDAAALNAIQKAWTDSNYMDHLLCHDDPVMVSLRKFLSEHGLPNSVLITCITSDARSRTWSKNMKAGKLDPKMWENPEIIERIERWKEFVAVVEPTLRLPVTKHFLYHTSMVAALIRFMCLLGCRWEQFMSNIQQGCAVRPCRTVEQYMEMFVDIHNYRQKDRLQFRPGQLRQQTEYKNNAAYKVYDSAGAPPLADKPMSLSFSLT